MSDRGKSMGPHVGNRPPWWCLPPDDGGKTRLPPCPSTSGWLVGGQEDVASVRSVADHEGRDRSPLG